MVVRMGSWCVRQRNVFSLDNTCHGPFPNDKQAWPVEALIQTRFVCQALHLSPLLRKLKTDELQGIFVTLMKDHLRFPSACRRRCTSKMVIDLDRLPPDLAWKIAGVVALDCVLLSRRLMRVADACLKHLDFEGAVQAWSAIQSLSFRDKNVMAACILHHDRWYQSLEDPYDMSLYLRSLAQRFLSDLEPVLRVTYLDERTHRSGRASVLSRVKALSAMTVKMHSAVYTHR